MAGHCEWICYMQSHQQQFIIRTNKAIKNILDMYISHDNYRSITSIKIDKLTCNDALRINA